MGVPGALLTRTGTYSLTLAPPLVEQDTIHSRLNKPRRRDRPICGPFWHALFGVHRFGAIRGG
jgi:hypothetical protein